MSERVKKIIGDELYAKVIEKIEPDKFDLLDGFVPRKTFNEKNDKAKLLEEKIAAYEKQIADTQNMLKDSEDLKIQYGQLQEKYNLDLQAKDVEINNIMKKSIFKELLTKQGAKHPDLLMKDVKWDTLSVENNNLIGATEVLNNIKTEYADLFVNTTAEGNEPKNTNNNNNNNNKVWDFSKL